MRVYTTPKGLPASAREVRRAVRKARKARRERSRIGHYLAAQWLREFTCS